MRLLNNSSYFSKEPEYVKDEPTRLPLRQGALRLIPFRGLILKQKLFIRKTNQNMHTLDTKSLKSWFMAHQRELPWREDRSPYAVWVSEMMLQQTQVAVVIPYFERWMKRFPSIQALANAPLDDVIKVWEGLGYYSRARYLHQGAQQIVQNHKGIFPQIPEELSKIKGIGPYTVGAICSFAFQQKMAAVDGNVIRVLARYFMIEHDIAKTKTVQHLREIAEEILPEKEPWVINEALIELGATVCMRKPNCGACPLKKGCLAYRHNKCEQLPYKSSKTIIQRLYRSVAVIRSGDSLLIKRGVLGEVMSDLHEFPYMETTSTGGSGEELKEYIEQLCGTGVMWEYHLPIVKHSFTRFRVELKPSVFSVRKQAKAPASYQWLTISELERLAFSSGHRRIFHTLQQRKAMS